MQLEPLLVLGGVSEECAQRVQYFCFAEPISQRTVQLSRLL
ncbi:hypothetical protein Strvi_6509 [Streptomyces violaceusniger Tu 4113]|uniref:Uncharacterized protein n=1 Tax=Streptomyces violaceusniger (strain Tu 4113) TaxID=653045 RepID=G2NVN7_STRV4|nr:hypothetical protein Strvi_6509 [Streptomyces violaceusniger Tu 4113]